jgi:hypothetical protein
MDARFLGKGSIKREIARQNIAMRTTAMPMVARYSHQGGHGGSCWGGHRAVAQGSLDQLAAPGLAAAHTIMRTSSGRVAFRFLMKKQALPHPRSPKSVHPLHFAILACTSDFPVSISMRILRSLRWASRSTRLPSPRWYSSVTVYPRVVHRSLMRPFCASPRVACQRRFRVHLCE